MTLSLRFAFTFLCCVSMGALAPGQDVLYDFDSPLPDPGANDPFLHFGTITTDSSTISGVLPDCNGIAENFCASHTGDFTASPFDPNEFGLGEIGPHSNLVVVPPFLDLTPYVGYSIDARFVRDTDGLGGAGVPLFTGDSPIKFGVQWDPTDPCNGSMSECSDLYDAEVELTETWTTYTVMFDDFLQGRPRNSVQIKMLMLTGEFDPTTNIKLTDHSDGVGRLEFDNIIGLLPPTVSGDFNNDNEWNCLDIDALTMAIATMSGDLSFDMNGDGSLTPGDITDPNVGWLAVGGANNTAETGGNPFLMGDANLDGTVDGPDFLVWNNNKFTNSAAWCSGDFNADGATDGPDFLVWNNNKFTSSDAVNAVPEPCSGILMMGALVGLVLVRRR